MKRRAQPLCTHSCSFKNSACRSVHTHRQTGSTPSLLCGLKGFLHILRRRLIHTSLKTVCFKRVINVAVFVRLVGKLWNNDSIVSDSGECRLLQSHICTFGRSQLLLGGGGNLNKLASFYTNRRSPEIRRNMTVLEEYKNTARVNFYTPSNNQCY